MTERSELISWIRAELVGPSQFLHEPAVAEFTERDFHDSKALRRGSLSWRPDPGSDFQEVLYYDRETPHRKYGAGLLHPAGSPLVHVPEDVAAAEATDPMGAEADQNDSVEDMNEEDRDDDLSDDPREGAATDETDDFEVTSPDIRHPSTMGLSFCAHLPAESHVVVRLPHKRQFAWQADAREFLVNGRYEHCTRRWTDEKGVAREAPIWRRRDALAADTQVIVNQTEIRDGRAIRKKIQPYQNSLITLWVEVFPRKMAGADDQWLLYSFSR